MGIIKRHGLAIMRHLHCGFLWVQEAWATKFLDFDKVKGTEIPSDGLTKHVAFE